MGAPWVNLGQQLRVNAKKYPSTICLKDKDRSFTFPETNKRVNRLANGLLSIGLKKGDKIAFLLENSIEICELYFAVAKIGLIAVPVNFRLAPREVQYIINNSDAKAFVVHNEFIPCSDEIKNNLKNVGHYFVVGNRVEGYQEYEDFISGFPETEPDGDVAPEKTWILLYTSGTTGKPKGVVRSHESHIAFYLINAIDFGFTPKDVCLNVMPLCHVNSTFFTFTFTYIGASVYVHPASNFKAEDILEIIEKEKITFISLIPTHYNLILAVPGDVRNKYDVTSIRKLLCSSAPGRKEMKKEIMKYFKNVELYEAYGSTEAGIVTTLMPEFKYSKLGSIGQESVGTDFVKIMDGEGNELPSGEIGEIFSRGPMLFDEYYKEPEKTKEAFKNGWFSAGDIGRIDEDGFFYIMDRKDNMIITGGENVYPSDVEEVICQHPAVFDTAVIGIPHDKWGEAVMAVVILKDGQTATEQEIIDFCRGKMAAFKKPKKVTFIKPDEMPRTPATGKISHRKLREIYSR
jgi:acyl-CoA synthetase (AMP-forming)/AMP-acid ligase II